ncbi:DAK2 domain-containing protein [Streptomyces sp. NPDC020794]|uniref:DAK2 domain-containing protein n=1 Tax=unclassified Streptomyces TaxID=2593676 RepID=UPI0036E2656C
MTGTWGTPSLAASRSCSPTAGRADTDALEQRLAEGGPGADATELARPAAATARTAADATTSMQARRGRQSYTGERSIGSPDPGAVAVAVIAERVAAQWDAHD